MKSCSTMWGTFSTCSPHAQRKLTIKVSDPAKFPIQNGWLGARKGAGRADKWRFAAPVHHHFSIFAFGGPALEANWSHPTLKKAIALYGLNHRYESFFDQCRILNLTIVVSHTGIESFGVNGMIRLAICGLDESRIDEIARRIRGASVTRLPDLPAGDVVGVECDAVACFGSVPPDVRFIANTIQTGRHIFIATEVLPSLTDLKSLTEQANTKGVHIQIENPDHGLPSRRLIFDELRGSKLGQLGLIRSHRWESTPGLRSVDTFHLPAPLVRDLELMLWLTGQMPTTVYAVEHSAQQGDTRGTIHVHIGFADGGMVLMDYADCLLPGDGYQSLSTICANGAMYADDHQNRQLAYRGGTAQATPTDEGLLPFVTLIQQFVTRLSTPSPIESGLARWERTCALAETVRQSLDRRSPVAFDSIVHSPDQALQGSV